MTSDLAGDARDLNTLSRFLARMDLPELTPVALEQHWGRRRADLLILLGNSVLATAERAAEGVRAGVAERMLISGGIGHSTEYLRDSVRRDPRFAGIGVDERAEGEILRDVLVDGFSVDPDRILVETRSTNCGGNAVESRRLLDSLDLSPRTVILVQDPTMQLRSWASFRHVWADRPDVGFLNYPAFVPLVHDVAGALGFQNPDVPGLWPVDRYLSLLMGEIPRLRDDEHGYGPRGRGFIAHVDVPPEVEEAYARLLPRYGRFVRSAPARSDSR